LVVDAGSPGLELELESTLPRSLPAGRGTAVFCFGTCSNDAGRVEALELLVDGEAAGSAVVGMPRLDAAVSESGFWGVVRIGPRDEVGEIELGAEILAAGLGATRMPLGRIEIVEPHERRRSAGSPPTGSDTNALSVEPQTIAICMTTYEPDIRLLRVQVESIRAQSDDDWLCVISDDCSSPERFAEIEQLVGGDPRFSLSRSERRLGFYRNFERCLELAPAEARLVALSDQDDRWHADKLATLRASLGDAALVYSDQRVVDPSGSVISETYWTRRRNNRSDLLSLLFANTITGASALYRRDVVDLALPFPDAGGEQYHDHWLALVALSVGEARYVDRPLYDYVQHPAAVLGHRSANVGSATGRIRGLSVGSLRNALVEWRFAYFDGCARLELLATALLARCGGRMRADRRRDLRRFLAGLRSPLGIVWLALRPLRRLAGRNETLGAERLLVRGLIWRRYMALRARRPRSLARLEHDARPPSTGPGGGQAVHPRAARAQ
jgi:glycosyltransferase involved in cell wall biosynthesis